MSPWQFLKRLVSLWPGRFALNILLWTAMAVLPLGPGLIMRAYFAGLASDRLTDTALTMLLAAFGGCIITRLGIILLAVWVDVTLQMTCGARVRGGIVKAVFDLPASLALGASVGEAVVTLRDDVDELELYVSEAADFIGMAIFGAMALVLMLRISVPITLGACIPLTGIMLSAKLASTRVVVFRQRARAAASAVGERVVEIFVALDAIRFAGREDAAVQSLARLNETRRAMTVKERMFSEALTVVGSSSATLGTGFVLVSASSAMREGRFTVGDFALFVSYLPWIAEVFVAGGTMVNLHHKAAVSIKRLAALFPQAEARPNLLDKPVVATPSPAAVPFRGLELRRVSYRYQGSNRGIRDIDLALAPQTLTVVTGKVGAGKTTLLRVAIGALPPDSGERLWNGAAVRDINAFAMPPHVAYTPQIPHLLSDTLRNNVALGLDAGDDTLNQAAWLAAFDEDLAAIAEGWACCVGPRGMRLSGGQVQRVAVARMLAREAQIYVMDDVSSALDVHTEACLFDRLLGARRGTLLVVSNRPALLSRADQVVVMKDGQVEAIGDFKMLRRTSAELGAVLAETSVSGVEAAALKSD